MKKLILSMALLAATTGAFAFPKAIYVKQGDNISRYNFGVASDLKFSDNGKKLTVTGYGDVIELDKIDFISFSAPVDETAMTPASQKDKMIQIGQDVNAMIDLNRNDDLLRMFSDFFADGYVNGEYIDGYLSYEVPEEYWNVHKKTRNLLKAFRDVVNGDVSAVTRLAAAAPDLYQISDYTGIYTANKKTKTWERIEKADYLEIRFEPLNGEGDYYSVRLTPSTDYSVWDCSDALIHMPKTLDIMMRQGNKTLASGKIATDLSTNEKIDMTVDMDANGYTVHNVLHIVNDRLTNDCEVKIDGKHLVKSNTVIPGKNLVQYDEMRADIKEAMHYHDADGNCQGEDPTALIAHFYRAQSDVDVIGKLQAKARGCGFSDMYEVLSEDADYELITDNGYSAHIRGYIIRNEGNGTYQISYEQKDLVENKIQTLNNYIDASFYYDGKPQLQGFLSFDLDVDKYSHEDSYYEDDYYRYGFANIDGFLVGVHSEKVNDEWSPWKYNADRYEQDGGYSSISIEIDDKYLINDMKEITEVYYDIIPVLSFPDLSSYTFDDYFTESAFKALVDDYKNLINTYDKITGRDSEF